MRKADTLKRKAASTRNRHNGRINAAKQHIMDKGQSFQMSDGSIYSAMVRKRWIQDQMAFLKDSDGAVTDMLDPSAGWEHVSASIVKTGAVA